MPKEPMTEERIAEIRGREKAATQGPWVFEEPDGKVLLGYTSKEVRVCESGCLGSIASRFVCDMHSDWRYTYKDKNEPMANAAFIAHAREDIPALLNEVERLRAENESLKLRVCERQERFVAQNWRNVEQKRYSFKKFRVFKYN